jgi:PIN domain nuclease of toxin-antitoxin system
MEHHVSKVLLDTHVLLWWLAGARQLSGKVRRLIESSETLALVSAASAWEIAIKHSQGKLQAEPLLRNFQGELDRAHFAELPVSIEHAIRAAALKGSHKDPFDRMLAAQAQIEGVPILSTDTCFGSLGVTRIW